MSNHLSGAYRHALEKLREEKGEPVALVVEAVIESKQVLSELEDSIQTMSLIEVERREIMQHMIEQVSSGVATMCNLIGMGFREDIMPLVEQVTKQATKKMQ